MTVTRADTHDLDKLDRWRNSLEEAGAATFPAIAIFVVAAEHTLSHDIFREFRTSFETHGAEFHHLVIFGQHGVSTTVTGFLRQTGLDLDSLPCLALATDPQAMQAHLLPLPAGARPDPSAALDQQQLTEEPWRAVLNKLESAADAGSTSVDYSGIPGGRTVDLGGGDLMSLVASLQELR